MLLTGSPLAKDILESTKVTIEENGIIPGLGVILVGSDAASQLYVGIKERRAQELGIYFEKKIFPTDATAEEIQAAILVMNKDQKLHGIIVQLPLPEHLDTDTLLNCIDPQKDTDGFHTKTLEKFLAGDQSRLPVFPRALIELARVGRREQESQNKSALAVVNSELMGTVLQTALEMEGYRAQYVLGRETEKIATLLPGCAVVLTAVGTPGVVSAEHLEPGAVVVDGGIFYDQKGEVIGDVAREEAVYREDIWVTPVPGGVGPVTVAVLMARVTEAALRKN